MKIDLTNKPKVRFEYPDSETNAMRVRYVVVTECDDTYIKGIELENFNSVTGKFKQYARKRIVQNGISLLSFK